MSTGTGQNRQLSQTPHRKGLQVGGAVDPELYIYIERGEDETLFDLLLDGEYCNVLSSRQMGKSSAMMYAAKRLDQAGVAYAFVELAGGLGQYTNSDRWYMGFFEAVTEQLEERPGIITEVELKNWWRERTHKSPSQLFQEYMRDVVLRALGEQPLVIFVDEIDASLNLDFTDDFFSAIRAMYNQRPMVPAYQQVTFCLLGVAQPDELIRSRRVTPYNIGITLALGDFSRGQNDPQLRPLEHLLGEGGENGRVVLDEILFWTGGHPFLTVELAACYLEAVARADAPGDNISALIAGLVEDLYNNFESVSGRSHFSFIDKFMTDRAGLASLSLYQRVLHGQPITRRMDKARARLELSGLVKRERGNQLVVRNRIYERIYDQDWVARTRPVRRTRLLRAAVALAFVTLLVALGWAWYDENYIQIPTRRADVLAAELSATADEDVALQAYERLAGLVPDEELGRHLTGHHARAERLYKAFRDRRAATITKKARYLLETGAFDDALVMAAFAATKNDGQVPPDFQALYEKLGYGSLAITLRGHEDAVNASVFTPDGRVLMSVADDGTLRVWDVATGQQLGVPRDVAGFGSTDLPVNRIALIPTWNGEPVLLTSSRAGMITRWRLPEQLRDSSELGALGDPLRIAPEQFDDTVHATLHPDGKHLLSTGYRAYLWRLDRFDKPEATAAHAVIFAAFSPDGERVVLATEREGASVWRSDLSAPIGPPLSHGSRVVMALFGQDGQQVLTGAHDGYVRLWNLDSPGTPAASFPHQTPDGRWFPLITSVAWCERKGLIASSAIGYGKAGAQVGKDAVGMAGQVMVWRSQNPELLLERFPSTTGVLHVAFSPDCRFIASSEASGQIRVWRLDGVEDRNSEPSYAGDAASTRWPRQLGLALDNKEK